MNTARHSMKSNALPGGGAAATPARRRGHSKILWSLVAVALAASIAGLGTYASFTSSTSASQSITAGTVVIALGTAGSATNRLTIAASNIAPTDTIQRAADVTNTSSLALASITLTTSATTTSLMDTDATNGLQMVIDKCSASWTEAGTSPAFTYTCSGTTTSVLASRAVIGSAIALSAMTLTAGGGVDHLRVTLTLPSSAPNTMQGLNSVISYSFTATQRTSLSE